MLFEHHISYQTCINLLCSLPQFVVIINITSSRHLSASVFCLVAVGRRRNDKISLFMQVFSNCINCFLYIYSVSLGT